MPISEQLRQAIRDSGLSANTLARNCGVPQPTITRFLKGQEIRSGTADRLADYFGLTLVADRQKRKK